MAFLGISPVLKSDGNYIPIQDLVVGDEILTYVSASGTTTSSNEERVNIGHLTSSTITSIDTSSLVQDFINDNLIVGEDSHGLFFLSSSVNIFENTRFSADTLIYTQKGFKNINNLTEGFSYLNSLESGSYSSNEGWHQIKDIEFYTVTENDTTESLGINEFDKITPLYKLEVQNNESYVVGQFIVHTKN